MPWCCCSNENCQILCAVVQRAALAQQQSAHYYIFCQIIFAIFV